ncbi:MAG: chemotaxis protein CheW [Bacteroidales bacterium]|nr:chemotaxis protein CheW [Bacteroidales bacterium]MDD4672322.1 chemotaxis protein CheW [Bacteroidales bacterium]MDY0349173.1 chemotaxis protein CheW [Tenuifilaceae bacterium]
MNQDNLSRINSYLSFKLGDEEFAAHVGKVLNILEMTRITEVPKAPNYMKGVINLRGTVLPVIDTRIKFGMTPTEFTANTCIVVLDIQVDGESIQIGALVDSVQAVLEIEKKNIMPPPSIGSKYKSEFIVGVASIDEKFIMILDMDAVFSVEDVTDLKIKAEENEMASEIEKTE